MQSDDNVTILSPKDWSQSGGRILEVHIAGIADHGIYYARVQALSDFQMGYGYNIKSKASFRRRDEKVCVAELYLGDSTGEFVISVCTRQKIVAACGIYSVALPQRTGEIRPFAYPLPVYWTKFSNFLYYRDLVPSNEVIDIANLSQERDEKGRVIFALSSADEHHDASACLMDSLCVGQLEFAALGHSRPEFVARPVYVARFAQADVLLRFGIITDAAGVWGDSAFSALPLDPQLANHPMLFCYGGVVGSTPFDGAHVSRKADRPYCLISNAGHGNIAHWLMNSLFAAYYVAPAMRRISGKMICPPLPEYARESLELMGLADLVEETSEQHILFDDLFYPSFLSTHANMYPPECVVDYRKALIQAACASPFSVSVPSYDRVYITRKDTPSKRILKDEQALIGRLETLGFVVLVAQELSFIEKALIFSRAKVMMAQLGAGMSHMLFMEPASLVIEVTSPSYHSDEYWYLASRLQQKFLRFVCSESPAPGAAIDMHLGDIDKVVQSIEAALVIQDQQSAASPGRFPV